MHGLLQVIFLSRSGVQRRINEYKMSSICHILASAILTPNVRIQPWASGPKALTSKAKGFPYDTL